MHFCDGFLQTSKPNNFFYYFVLRPNFFSREVISLHPLHLKKVHMILKNMRRYMCAHFCHKRVGKSKGAVTPNHSIAFVELWYSDNVLIVELWAWLFCLLFRPLWSGACVVLCALYTYIHMYTVKISPIHKIIIQFSILIYTILIRV